MIPARFDYVAPPDVTSCVEALSEDGRLLAGGTWVLPEMGRSESGPTRLVDLRHAGLGTIEDQGSGVHLGAMCTYADVLASAPIQHHVPLLRQMALGVTGGVALRNQATLGGSAAAVRPQSDVPAALVASGAEAVTSGPEGERRLPVQALFVSAMTNALLPGEVLLGFDLPSSHHAGHGYVKLKRGASSWPIATAGSTMRLDQAGRCREVTLALGGVSAVPLLVDLSSMMVGEVPDEELLRAASEQAGAAVRDPWEDALAPAEYRAAVAAPVARRSLTMARDNAGAAGRGGPGGR